MPTDWYLCVMSRPTKQSPDRGDARTRLLEAARDAIRQQGYAATTIDDTQAAMDQRALTPSWTRRRAQFDRAYDALAKDAASVEMPPGETFGPNASPCSPIATAHPGCSI